MKKIYVFAILLFLILSLVIPVSANTAEAPLVVDLIAGQNEHAGDIKVWDDSTSLYVLYETVNPWCLTETHLAVASSLDGIPQANGNPIPGQFPYKNTHNCATNFLYTIPLNKDVCQIYIAAHAAVKSLGSTETAWGNGLDFSGNNWGTYFLYKPNICMFTPTPNESATLTETPTNTPTSTSQQVPQPICRQVQRQQIPLLLPRQILQQAHHQPTPLQIPQPIPRQVHRQRTPPLLPRQILQRAHRQPVPQRTLPPPVNQR